MRLEKAEKLLQRAVDIDTGRENGSISLPDDLHAVGIMALHMVFYDSDLVSQHEMIEILAEGGQTRFLIEALRDARLSEYTQETLDKMYNL